MGGYLCSLYYFELGRASLGWRLKAYLTAFGENPNPASLVNLQMLVFVIWVSVVGEVGFDVAVVAAWHC